MNVKALLAAVLLAATNFAWAGAGGLSIDNIEQHMNASNWAQTQTERDYNFTEKPINKFAVDAPRALVETDKFKNSNNGQV